MTTPLDPYLAGSIGIISLVLLFVFIAGTMSIIEKRNALAQSDNEARLASQLTSLDRDHLAEALLAEHEQELHRAHGERKGKVQ